MNLTDTQFSASIRKIDKPRTVSVLVAARNESAHIGSCLQALLQQQFPADRFEILVGDDHSEDDTAAIVEELRLRIAADPLSAYPPIRLFSITEKKAGLLGKANVLAQLADKARGELLLITDADVQVNPLWIRSMIRQFSTGVALVSGTVSLFSDSLFGHLQNADWLFYMGQCAHRSEKGEPVTAIGCNMGIRTSSYRQIGGYEAVPFSVTEDYELFRVVREAGYECRHVLDRSVLVITHPVRSFRDLLRQRKRWLTGSFRKNRAFIISHNRAGLYLPFLLASGFLIHPFMPLILLSMTWLEKIIFLRKVYKKLALPIPAALALYPFYRVGCNFLFLFLQIRPGTVTWKGRPYGA